jgi:DNA invertase Pin-like site-specific DNA recombinase
MIAIYARQSIDRPDSVSIEAQIDQCEKKAQGNVQVYADSGYSGKNINRPEFERMLQDIKNDKISVVISYRLDRISRNIIDFANLLKLFEEFGVNYISATEQFDTSSPMGRAMIYIVMVFAQLERETIATRIADNYRYRANLGLFMGGNTPFGYDNHRMVSDGRNISILEPNENADLLRRIFDKFSLRESLNSICHEFNQSGIKTAKGNIWSSNAIRRILQNISPCCADNKIYNYLTACGYNISNGIDDFDGTHGMCMFFKNKNRNQMTDISEQTAVIGLHKPLISSDQYIRVQRILSENEPIRSKRSNRTFLAGIVKCASCGYTFGVKYTSRNGKDYSYYRCRGRENRGVCNNDLYVTASDLENIVINRCKDHLKEFSFDETAVYKKDFPEGHFEIERIKEQIQNLIDNVGKGNSVVDDLLTQKIMSLQMQMDTITAESRKTSFPAKSDCGAINKLVEQIDNFSELSIQQKIDAVRLIVKEITIDNNGHVNVAFLF